jgi:hypothetical protein
MHRLSVCDKIPVEQEFLITFFVFITIGMILNKMKTELTYKMAVVSKAVP